MNKFIFYCFLLCLPLHALGAGCRAISTAKRFEMAKLSEEAIIDGVLDEAIWQQATLITDLHQVNPFEFCRSHHNAPKSEFITLKMPVFVSARMWDDQAEEITAQVLTQNASIRPDDWFFSSI